MSIFSSIKDAIFGRKARAQSSISPTQSAPTGIGDSPVPIRDVQPAPSPMAEVDVEANLAEMASGKDLNWRTSIVDLMKLIGVDSSLSNRKALARELGYSGELDGSADMNLWLHKATMRELAANGGKVPAELLD